MPSIGKIRFSKLTPGDVATMLRNMDEQGYSPSTQRMARATLRRALWVAEQDGILSRNVAAIAEGPKLERREGRTLTPEQARLFLQAATRNRLEVAYMLTLALGLRRGEVLGLAWSDVSATEGAVAITVQRQLIRDKSGVRLGELKTSGSRRVLHLSTPFVEALERHRIRQGAEELVRGPRWRNDHDLDLHLVDRNATRSGAVRKNGAQDRQGSRSWALVDPRAPTLMRVACSSRWRFRSRSSQSSLATHQSESRKTSTATCYHGRERELQKRCGACCSMTPMGRVRTSPTALATPRVANRCPSL